MNKPFAYIGEQAYSRLKFIEPKGNMNGGVVTTITRIRSFPDDVPVFCTPRRKLSKPQIAMLYQNHPEIHEDVKSYAAFMRVLRLAEAAHGLCEGVEEDVGIDSVA